MGSTHHGGGGDSGSAVTKRASSISGTIPDVFHACEPGVGMEPGLALIDEVGKRALTTAFIQVHISCSKLFCFHFYS